LAPFDKEGNAMRRSTFVFTCIALYGALFAGAVVADQNPAVAGPDPVIAAVVAGDWRTPDYRLRDRYRHPAETLTFFGVRANASLIEITPGTGWYAEILAPLLKPGGHYTAAVMRPAQADDYQDRARTKLKAKFAADPAHYGAAEIVEFDPAAPVFGAPASADFVVSFRNVHNWVKAGTEAAFFKAFFVALKPGGVLGIVDHRAKPGSELNKDSGYLPEDYVVQLALDAGFRLDTRSEINANPNDTKDYPKGVWTLPPSLVLGEQDKAKYLAIGESDRFTLRFVKPSR
jgi:predicted methyltransferase